MSSLNLAKIKQHELKALLRHCDKNERLKVEHSNEDINKEMTWKNAQFCGSYEEVCNYFDDILRELDSKPKANTRYDRVVAYAIEGTLPEPDEEKDTQKQRDAWIAGIEKVIKREYPEMVVLAKYIHYDEVHEYINPENGERVFSRPHVHMYVMPVIEGRLNGKKFFQHKTSLIQLHRQIDDLTRSIYGFSYGNGTKKKSFDSVEHLKYESKKAELEKRRAALVEMEKDLINRQVALHQQELIVFEREQQVNRREAKLMSIMNSDHVKKMMQELDVSTSENVANPVRGKKRIGKIKPTIENEIEIL